MAEIGPPPAQVWTFWKEFDFEGFRGKLDEQGLLVAEKQETSLSSRRKLAETTKDFKRTASSDAVKQVGVLLKSYQLEVDQLTARAKSGESAFLDVYQKLYEAPDPAPCLASGMEAVTRSSEVEAQLVKLSQELAEYKAESKELKNQGGTIRRLEEKIRSLEAQMHEKERQLEEAVASAEAAGDLEAADETARREQALLEALSEAQSSLSNMKKLHDASQKQLFSMQSRSEEEQALLQNELEVATAEVERAQQRLMAIEREKDALREQVGTIPASVKPESAEAPRRAAEDGLRAELRAQRELANRLQSDLSAVCLRAEEESSSWLARCDGLRAALQAQEAHADALEQELTSRPSLKQVEDLRQQLRVLQAVGFGSIEGEDGQQPEHASPGAMEAVLLDKARKLEHQLTTARLRLAEAAGEAEATAARIGDLEAEVAAKSELAIRLEEDLLAAQPGSRPLRSATYHDAANGLQDMAPADSPEQDERTMVGVLCSQRDRFRSRVLELEEGLVQASSELKSAKRDLEGARADNVSLVERLRYVQGYQASSRVRNDVESGHIESKYASAYEEKLNPFSDWREREKASRKRQLNMADRVMYEFGQFISSSQRARIFVVVYSVALHLLIFWVLAKWGHGPAHHISGSELQLLCARHEHDGSFSSADMDMLADSSFGRVFGRGS